MMALRRFGVKSRVCGHLPGASRGWREVIVKVAAFGYNVTQFHLSGSGIAVARVMETRIP
jgi:hypothetical protein